MSSGKTGITKTDPGFFNGLLSRGSARRMIAEAPHCTSASSCRFVAQKVAQEVAQEVAQKTDRGSPVRTDTTERLAPLLLGGRKKEAPKYAKEDTRVSLWFRFRGVGFA
ncbi:MAG: hypothetical protein L6Q93_12470 [Phycisphaerae bacterium]|nr:MAG: hypothetical protein F9K17_13720 [Phycisphaerae bacterium]MCK6465636.1 hypothetical protein [Phycisphaerae bacterium]NUQ10555.1 hypothetical protein [Phycisphaerae bacterium]